ncbi:cysteine proteinase inhibitor-like isoform X2 [Salvia miltiorrhiza]|uniref:cysteine proteinase inhibitor-like isoform X2 n=1 Tax=Salvia miltiorrhiza TaxID=226208 RepID=UPI0025ACF2B9|nr:cysteine proteinase inhibitor-like isoform X2 [Salvia miltiorrhiza]
MATAGGIHPSQKSHNSIEKEDLARFGGIHPSQKSHNSIEIEDLARFAVAEHNKKENTLLEFKKVIDVKEQVVAGTMYYITLVAADGGKDKVYEAADGGKDKVCEAADGGKDKVCEAADGGKDKVYEAKVLEQSWMNIKQLEEFKLLGDASICSSVQKI